MDSDALYQQRLLLEGHYSLSAGRGFTQAAKKGMQKHKQKPLNMICWRFR